MSARSIRRAQDHRSRRDERRSTQRAKRVGIGAGGLLAAALVMAPGAQAAGIEVNSAADPGDGTCDAAECTLREAVHTANGTADADLITFAANLAGPIDLADAQGSIRITDHSLEIRGPGADNLTIDGPVGDRIFKVFGFEAPDDQVTISGLTLTNGDAQPRGVECGFDAGRGGAILSTNFLAFCNDGNEHPAALTVSGLAIVDNAATSDGGGIAVFKRSVSTDKAAGGPAAGQPVSGEASLTVERTTLSGNDSDGNGGGIALGFNVGSLLVHNSTIAGNTAAGSGGGITIGRQSDDSPPTFKQAASGVAVAPTQDIENTTVAANDAGTGGGIDILEGFHVGLSSTVVADNTAQTAPDLWSDGGASYEVGYSLLETTTGATVNETVAGSNITGQDPQLGNLAANGGPTQTKLPATTSRAVDAGVSNAFTAEQRGTARTVDRPPANATGGDGTDMGAVELPLDPVPAPPPEEPIIVPEPEPTPIPAPAVDLCFGKVVLLQKGGDAPETIPGTGVDDGIFGGGGKDKITGIGGDDCLFGQVGNDRVEGGPGNDRANGDRDDDNVRGDSGSDDVRGQNGNDRVFGGPGDDTRVTGGAGDDFVSGGDGADILKGDGGNDVISLGGGEDSVHAGGGADTIEAKDGDRDKIICGTGKDVAVVDAIDEVDADCNTVHVIGH